MTVNAVLQEFVFWLLLAIPFGPTALNSMLHGMYQPRYKILFSPLGSTCASLLFCLAVIAGLGELVQSYQLIKSILRYVGSAFLFYLAFVYLRRAWSGLLNPIAIDLHKGPPSKSPFRDGLLSTLSNPKAFVVYLTVLAPRVSEFSSFSAENALLVATIMSAVFLTYSGYALLGRATALAVNAVKITIITSFCGGAIFTWIGLQVLLDIR